MRRMGQAKPTWSTAWQSQSPINTKAINKSWFRSYPRSSLTHLLVGSLSISVTCNQISKTLSVATARAQTSDQTTFWAHSSPVMMLLMPILRFSNRANSKTNTRTWNTWEPEIIRGAMSSCRRSKFSTWALKRAKITYWAGAWQFRSAKTEFSSNRNRIVINRWQINSKRLPIRGRSLMNFCTSFGKSQSAKASFKLLTRTFSFKMRTDQTHRAERISTPWSTPWTQVSSSSSQS